MKRDMFYYVLSLVASVYSALEKKKAWTDYKKIVDLCKL